MDKEKIRRILEERTSVYSGTGCWEWKGAITANGYGKIWIDNKTYLVHRLSAHLFLGLDLASDLMALHQLWCSSRACWNPEHLYIGTAADNAADRGIYNQNKGGGSVAKTHCKYGHEFTEDNIYVHMKNGKEVRDCRTCKVERARQYKAKKLIKFEQTG